MDEQKLFELYEKLYFHEIEAREKTGLETYYTTPTTSAAQTAAISSDSNGRTWRARAASRWITIYPWNYETSKNLSLRFLISSGSKATVAY